MGLSMGVQIDRNVTFHNTTFTNWGQDPNSRGTLTILLSCISTLFICVWTVMHLNLPQRDESRIHYFCRHCKWCFFGLTGPEPIVWIAWRQYTSARTLLVESRHPQRWQKSQMFSDSEATSPWTITHGFYAGMCGFVVEMDDPNMCTGPAYITDCDRLIITPKGIHLLAQCGLLPDIREEEITDKSKTDALGKLLAVVQGSWMLMQQFARLTLGLPVTLLEVFTSAHVLCAIVVYIIWWNKPRWVTQPTRLNNPSLKPLLAFMYMCSHISAQEEHKAGILRDLNAQSEIAKLTYFLQTGETDTMEKRADNVSEEQQNQPHNVSEACHGHFRPRRTVLSADGAMVDVEQLDSTTVGSTQSTVQERHRLAAIAISQHPILRSSFRPVNTKVNTKYESALRNYPEMPRRFRRKSHEAAASPSDGLSFDGEQYVTKAAGNWPNEDLFRHTEGLLMGSILWFATIGFSAVHIAAWHAIFPTEVEAWLWRGSPLLIGGSGLLWLLIHVLARFSKTVWWYWFDLLSGSVRRLDYVLLGIPCTVCGTSYILARLYLVVEAFICLRWLPATAFENPSWLLVIPHVN